MGTLREATLPQPEYDWFTTMLTVRKRMSAPQLVAGFFAALLGFSFATEATPRPAAGSGFVYRAGYQRFNRYQYRNHAWLRVGVFFAPAPGFYPTIGYLGFIPPPVYALPPSPPYAYPAPYVSPAVPYAYGSPAVPYYYSYGGAIPFGVPYMYGGFRRGSYRYRGFGARAWYGGHGGWYAHRYGYGYPMSLHR